MKRNRGIALFTVLTIAFLLTVMTIALIGNHQANFALLADSVYQRQAVLAASSGVDFSKYKLELDRTYGGGFTETKTVTWGDLEVTEVKDSNIIKGVFVGSSPARTFTVEIGNYLGGGAPAEVSPSHCVRLRTTGTCEPFQQSTEIILVEAPLYDSAACSNGGMDMSAVNNWFIDSLDPLRNWVRSNQSVETPNFLSDATKKMQFIQSTCPNPGVAWSRGDIYIGNTTTNMTVDAANAAGKASDILADTVGLMAPHSNLNYNIYDLKMADLKKPPTADVEIPPGNYTVTTSTISYTDTDIDWWGQPRSTRTSSKTVQDLKYTDPSGNVKNIMIQTEVPQPGQVADWHWDGTTNGQNREGWVRTERTVVKPPNPVELAGSVVNISTNFSSGEFSYDFSTNTFTGTNSNPLHIGGDLNINSTSNTPNVVFVDPTQSGQTAFMYANTTTPGAGSISLEGTVSGRGGVAAQRDLTLAANSNLTANKKDLGLVLWGGRNVTFDVAKGQDMLFRGLIFCKNDVSLKFNGDPAARNQLNTLIVDGALVAQTGSIKMGDANTVNMTYDPDYLKLFTNGLPSGTARFAQVSFKVF